MGVANRSRAEARVKDAQSGCIHELTPATGGHARRLRDWLGRLLLATGLLMVFGLVASFSSTVFLNIALDKPAYNDFIRHSLFLCTGIAISLVAIWMINRFQPARRWLRIAIPLAFYISLGLVALVQVNGLAQEVNGARRFLNLGFIQFQPSELLKLTLVLYLSQLLCWWRRRPAVTGGASQQDEADYNPAVDVESRGSFSLATPRRTGLARVLHRDGRPVWPELPKRCVLIIVAALGLTAIQPDLGSTGILLGCSLLTLILAGVHWRALLGFITLVVLCGGLAVGTVLLVDAGKYDYAGQRISTWWSSIVSPAVDEDGPAYQLAQSRGALAAGGLSGRGFLKSDQKMNRLPLSTNDFVFPVLVEELGYLGGLAVILLLLNLAWAGMRLSCCCRDPFNKTVIAALGFTLCLQGFVNIGVTLGTLPLSGLTLPFFSYGGTSLVVSVVAVGIMYALGLSELRRPDLQEMPAA